MAFDLLCGAFVGELIVVRGFADGLLHLAGDFVELALQFAFGSSAHSPNSLLKQDAKKRGSACVHLCDQDMRSYPGRGLIQRLRVGLECSPTRQQVEDKNDNGENQQKVNPAAERITAHETEKPENYQDDSDRPKHDALLSDRAAKFEPQESPADSIAAFVMISCRAARLGCPVRGRIFIRAWELHSE